VIHALEVTVLYGVREGKRGMASFGHRKAVQPGEPAPSFEVTAVHREGTISLAEYRGKRPLFLALFRGLY
jgi:hypothetical protein